MNAALESSPVSPPADRPGTAATSWFICLTLALLTLAVFWPVRHFEFINYDDPDYVVNNPHVNLGFTWDNVRWAFTTGYSACWMPVVWLSYMVDAELFGRGAGGPHLVNVVFHIANTLLLYGLLVRMTGAQWRSAMVAALFALHPLHVESVAWVTERKDMLSTFFGLLAAMAYVRHVKSSGGAAIRWTSAYGLALVLFALALMSKPMVVTLPFVLLLLDFWPLKRFKSVSFRRAAAFRNLVIEKVPFFLLVVISSAITVQVQAADGALRSLASLGMSARLGNAAVAYLRYLAKTFVPTDLSVIYPHPGLPTIGLILLAIFLLVALTVVVVVCRRKAPYITVGWFWFLGTLVPVIGIVQFGAQSMADRFMYVPSIGLFISVVWAAGKLIERSGRPVQVSGVVAAAVLAGCAITTRTQLGYWHDSGLLFSHALTCDGNNYVAHYDLGQYWYEHGRREDAAAEYRASIRLQPGYEPAYNNLGLYHYDKGQLGEAVALYRQSLQMDQRHVSAYNNLGSAYTRMGRYDEALECFDAALRLRPEFTDAHVNRGLALARTGRGDQAMAEYQMALQLDPRSPQAHNNLANLLAAGGKLDEAISHYRAALEAKPDMLDVLNNLGVVLAARGNNEEAIGYFEQALRLRPEDAVTRVSLGDALAAVGRKTEAIKEYAEALRLQPKDEEAAAKLQALKAGVEAK